MSADAVPVSAAALPLQASPFRDQARQRAAAFDNLAEGILLTGRGSNASFSIAGRICCPEARVCCTYLCCWRLEGKTLVPANKHEACISIGQEKGPP